MYLPPPSILFLTSPLLHSSLPLYITFSLLLCPSFTPSPLPSSLSPSFPSLLFPSHPELVRHLFLLISGVPDTLRAQQLSMEQIGQLCTAYHKLVARTSFVIHHGTMRHLLDHFALIMHSILYVCIMTSSDHKC